MNNQQRGPQGNGGGGTQGSVRHARERMEAEMQQRANLQGQAQNRSRPQMPSGLTESRTAQGGLIGAAISRPTQVPQWPLADGSRNMTNAQYQPPAGRANPPQRPPRPSRVPSILDGSKLQDPTPSFQYKPQQAEQTPNAKSQGRYNHDESPIITSPLTPSSRQSTNSSIGTIPDFPVPMLPPVQPPANSRRNNGLGPPPSTRRGTSSYYSQTSLVSPIPEESQTSDKGHDSYASSAAIPVMWHGDPSGPDDDYDDRDDRDDRDDMYDGRGYGSGYWPHETIEEGRESRESNLDDSDDRGLIRSASLGKRAKPSVVTTKGADKQGQRSSPEGQQKPQSGKVAAAAVGPAAGAAFIASAKKDGQRETVWPMMGSPDSPLASGTGLIDSTSSSSEEVSQISKSGTVNSNRNVSPMQSATSSQERVAPVNRRLSGMRRPRNLDMDAVRDAEARGSLTSLPDLIRRATRLAAMMDRGKRPASRLNDLSDFPTAAEIEKDRQAGPRRQSTLSGMLAAFPPPGLATPTHPDSPRRRGASWPPPLDNNSTPGLDEKDQRPRRRCCGLPMWGFFIILVIILIIIAAAVVVPIELLVVHKKRSGPATGTAKLQQCQSDASTQCQNGGSSVLSDNSCSCICINGFTGPTCTVGGTTGCTTTSISALSDVTLGYSIPRLLSDAQSNFSIPLTPSLVLARFNSANLSCISENALVTFNGRTGSDNSKEIIRSRPRATTTDKPSSTSSSIISTTSDFFSTTFNSTAEVQDFARVAVLFLLQEDDLDTASTAQNRLQSFFASQKTTNEDALNVTLGGGNLANLVGLSVQLSNGTVFGSRD